MIFITPVVMLCLVFKFLPANRQVPERRHAETILLQGAEPANPEVSAEEYFDMQEGHNYIRSLVFLQKAQHADGSWGEKSAVTHTSLILLTFLAHGETPRSKIYGPTVKKAMRWLIMHQLTEESGL